MTNYIKKQDSVTYYLHTGMPHKPHTGWETQSGREGVGKIF